MSLYHGGVDGVARRQLFGAHHDSLGAFDDFVIDHEDLIHDSQERVQRWLNGVAPADRDVTVKDLLQHFGVRNEPPFLIDETA